MIFHRFHGTEKPTTWLFSFMKKDETFPYKVRGSRCTKWKPIMIDKLINENHLPVDTPYFLFDKEILKNRLAIHKKISEQVNVKLIYSVKSLSHIELLKEITKYVTGFSVSSVFETRLADYMSKEYDSLSVISEENSKKAGIKQKPNLTEKPLEESLTSLQTKTQYKSHKRHTIHFVSPGIKASQWDDISKHIHFMTFNSLEQFSRFKDKLYPHISYGIRLNPELSFIKDTRYNPCKKSSKLGVPLKEIAQFLSASNSLNSKNSLEGLHFHNNCDSHNFSELKKTFKKTESYLSQYFKQFQWINLGGGYIFNTEKNLSQFYELIQYLKKKYQFKHIIIEPGSSLVRDSVYLISSVIDIFKRDGENIAVLDTTTNHLPEVFEYQYQPDVLNQVCPQGEEDKSTKVFENKKDRAYKYILAGCSCLAGDIFGTYFFKNPLKMGSKVVFHKVGSYSLVKANMFNGINLPDIYCLENNIELRKVKSYTFDDYMNHCGR